MNFITSEITGMIFSLSLICFWLWYYFSKETVKESFLLEKIKSEEDKKEEIIKKSKKRLLIEERLNKLNNPISYNQLTKNRNLGLITIFIIFGLVLNLSILALFLMILIYFLPNLYLDFLEQKKIKLFKEQFFLAVSQLISVLKSGQTIVQGFDILTEYPYPLGNEFAKISKDLKTGASMESTLNDLYERIPLEDIKLLSIGLVLSQDASTSVAIKSLETTSNTIKKRESQKKSVNAMTAMGRYTALLLAILPPGLFVILITFMPDYINDFIKSPYGLVALGIAGLLDICGYLIAKKITNTSNIVKY